MTQKQNYVKLGPIVKIMVTLPDLNDTQLGELYYDATNGRLALRTTEGWKYFTED